MFRFIVCILIVLVPAVSQASGQPEKVIRFKVQPMPTSKPAAKYQLLPELRSMNPGNPIHAYLKCFSEQNHFFFSKEQQEEREKLFDMPLKDLPVAKLRGYGGLALRNADYAARLDNPDWQVLLQLKSAGIELLVPDLQQMRTLAAALQIRLRGEIADRRFDDALITAQTMLALSRHTGEHPTLIGSLVSIAIAHIASEPLSEMVGQPGCPNLFWALADLPHPFVDVRRAVQGERIFMMNEFNLVDEKAALSDAQMQAAVTRYQTLVDLAAFNPANEKLKPELRDWLVKRAKDEQAVAAARQRLIEFGLSKKLTGQFPPLQVILLNEKYLFHERRDEGFKGILLPYWQMAPSAVAKAKDESPLLRLAPVLAGLKVREARTRLEQRLALLRCIEALRAHAAEHEGNLPAQLADVKLPLPTDPFTGKAFQYKLEGDIATLHGTAPPPIQTVRFEISVAK